MNHTYAPFATAERMNLVQAGNVLSVERLWSRLRLLSPRTLTELVQLDPSLKARFGLEGWSCLLATGGIGFAVLSMISKPGFTEDTSLQFLVGMFGLIFAMDVRRLQKVWQRRFNDMLGEKLFLAQFSALSPKMLGGALARFEKNGAEPCLRSEKLLRAAIARLDACKETA